MSNLNLKEELYKELELKLDLSIKGISVDAEELAKLDPEVVNPNVLKGGRQGLPFDFVGSKLPNSGASLTNKPDSIYGFEVVDDKPYIVKYGRNKTLIGEIEFKKRRPQPEIFNRLTADGVPYNTIASLNENGQVHVNYSSECVLKEKGVDCYFCNYSNRNATVKTPQQVGEVYSELYLAGLGKHLNLTSGFMHERRELEFYLDVAEEIQRRTGLKEFRGTAVVGPSVDLTTIEKYKEAGFYSIRMNIEIWDKNIWKAICPGKDQYCGGWDNWVKALEHAVAVFGKGKVASNIVGGIESKKSILEGAEYKISRGIVASASSFRPTEGSFLEGHNTPTTEWHWDLQKKIAALYKNYDFTLDDLHNVSPGAGLAVTLFQAEQEDFENGKLRPYKYPEF